MKGAVSMKANMARQITQDDFYECILRDNFMAAAAVVEKCRIPTQKRTLSKALIRFCLEYWPNEAPWYAKQYGFNLEYLTPRSKVTIRRNPAGEP